MLTLILLLARLALRGVAGLVFGILLSLLALELTVIAIFVYGALNAPWALQLRLGPWQLLHFVMPASQAFLVQIRSADVPMDRWPPTETGRDGPWASGSPARPAHTIPSSQRASSVIRSGVQGGS